MKELLEYLLTSIIHYPEELKIEEKEENGQFNLNFKVHPEDVKIVIGKSGQTIKAIRELIKIKAIKEKKRVNVNLLNQ